MSHYSHLAADTKKATRPSLAPRTSRLIRQIEETAMEINPYRSASLVPRIPRMRHRDGN